jgi:hypothetical protein
LDFYKHENMPLKALFLALILHVVEFSRYDRAPRTAITHRLQGRPPNLMHARLQVNLLELKQGSKGPRDLEGISPHGL